MVSWKHVRVELHLSQTQELSLKLSSVSRPSRFPVRTNVQFLVQKLKFREPLGKCLLIQIET